VFNDGAFEPYTDRTSAAESLLKLEHGEPLRFGAESTRGVARDQSGSLEVVDGTEDLLVHDAHRDDPSLAFALSRLGQRPGEPLPIGVFRDVEHPVFASNQEALEESRSRFDEPELDGLLRGSDTWTVGA
jgi:2-oxoglutarate ferredoxin oxidoreductase subunit beta